MSSYHRSVGSTPRRSTAVPSSRSSSRPRSLGYLSSGQSLPGAYSSSFSSLGGYLTNPYSSSLGASGYTPSSSYGPSSSSYGPSYNNYGGGAYSSYGGTTSGYGSLHLQSSPSSSSSYLSSSPSSSFKHLTPGGYSKVNSRPAARLSPSRVGLGSRTSSSSSLAKSEASEGYASEDKSGRSSRLSSVSSTGGGDSLGTTPAQAQTAENGAIDYKKLYEESLVQNERLRGKLKKTEDDLLDARNNVEKNVNTNKTSLSEIEKRERRAMERKLSEMEEELKLLEALKSENQRLKDENGALIRVISKLSK